jgi:hypothetical protein
MYRRIRLLAVTMGVLVCFVAVGGGLSSQAVAAEKVTVIVGQDAPKLERFAAEELAGQFKQLFGAEVTIATVGDVAASADGPAVLVGNPQTNSKLRKLAGDGWPKLSDQGFVIKSVTRDGAPALVVGGDRPVATLWAIYELGQRFGIRYLLAGDVYPAESPTLRLTGFDVTAEPSLRSRAWQAIDDLPTGSSAWGLAEHQHVIGQLAKLKFNRVILNVYPWQPFVDFEFEGTRKSTAELFYGWKFPIDGDTAGRAAFQGAREFTNPDLAGKSSPAERVAAGKLMLNGIIDSAHGLGMSVGLCFSPLEFPPEFAPLLPGAEPCGPEKRTVGPGPQQAPDDERLRLLAIAQSQAFLRSYPRIDALYLTMPRSLVWIGHANEGWNRLLHRTPEDKRPKLPDFLQRVRIRELALNGEAAVRAIETQLAALDAIDRLPVEEGMITRPDGTAREIHLAGIDRDLDGIVAGVAPEKVGLLTSLEVLTRPNAALEELIENLSPDNQPGDSPAPSSSRSKLLISLTGDSANVLPKSEVSRLEILSQVVRQRGWGGYATRSGTAGDLDYALQFLAQASWSSEVSPDAALDSLITPMCGSGVTDRVALAFTQLEQATTLIAEQDADFATLAPDMVMKHYAAAEAPPEHWQKLQDLYVGAMNEMYRAHDRSHPRGRPYLRYYCKRLEFALEYVGSVQALRRAGAAKAAGDGEAHVAELEKATESMYNALSALSEVARDSGDRGAIAVLNAWGYRPLQQALADADAQ